MSTLWRRVIGSFLSGAVFSIAFAPMNIFLAGFLAPALLLGCVLGASKRAAFLCGMVHGVTFAGLSFPWIYQVMREHGGLSVVEAGGVYVLMILAFSMFPAAFAVLVAHCDRHSRTLTLCAAPFFWVMLEFARRHLPHIGFPWNFIGYAGGVDRNILLQLASIGGIYGVSFVMMCFCSGLAWQCLARSKRGFVVVAVVLIGFFLTPAFSSRLLPELRPAHVAYLVQPNFQQFHSYSADWMNSPQVRMDELERISIEAVRHDAAKQEKAGLQRPPIIIWPEVPAPFYFADIRFAERVQRVARDSGAYFLLGVVEWKAPAGSTMRQNAYNSAVLLSPAGQRVFQYDKIHLVPFGEYVPLRRYLTFAESLVQEVGGYQPGSEFSIGELPDVPGPAEFRTPGAPKRFGVYICYESVLPDLVRRFTANGAELLINISNDGWYGRSWGPEQHLAIARVRAIENRRWVLRGTNNGHTVSIDPYGRIAARIPPDERGVLAAPYDFRSDMTLYARFGDWVAWMCVIVSAVAFVFALRKVNG
jgi:apolipoprotein N-acyltransferase